MIQATRTRGEQGSLGHVLGWSALVLGLVALLIPLAALAFSVTVKGQSMEPTLTEGDRLLVKFWARDDVQRFDLVEARVGIARTPVVKRVIGLPGDTVSISFAGDVPTVTVRPAGSDVDQVVVNPTWDGRIGSAVAPCCKDDGTAGTEPRPVVVPDGHYWVLGDNWGHSDDSRAYGFVKASDVGGQLNLRLLPLGEFGSVENPASLR